MRTTQARLSGPGKRKSSLFGLNRLPPAPIGRLPFELAAIVLLCPILLHAALWNGFPFLFFDTGAYVLEGFGRVFVPERSPVYSLFLHYVMGRQNLWFVAIAQCLLVGFVLVEFARAVRPRTSLWAMLGIGAALALFTGLSWIAGQVEPDCLTPIVILTIYLLAFRLRALGLPRAVLMMFVAGFAIGCHPSHLGLAAGLALVSILVRTAAFVFRRRGGLPRPSVIAPLAGLLCGVLLIVAANYSLTRHVFLNRSGAFFFSARLIGDGVAKKTLYAVCPAHPLKLCPYKDYLPKTADSFLWGPYTPFNRIGRFYGPRAEYEFLISESLKRYPLEILGSGLWDSLRQFFMVRTGDGITPAEWVLNQGFASFMPAQSRAYLEARQQDGLVRFVGVNVVHVPLAFGALIWLFFALRQALLRRQWGRAVLPAYVLIALIGNAMVCGMFSGPHDRYQSRVIWIAPFALLLTERRMLPGWPGPRGRGCRPVARPGRRSNEHRSFISPGVG